MYKNCKTVQSQKRQRLIEDVMLQMMLKEQFSEIKVSSLCQKAGIPRKAFYRYFDTKEDVLCAVVDHALMDFSEACKNILKDNSCFDEQLMELFYKYWLGKKDFLKALEMSNFSNLLIERSLWLENNEHMRVYTQYLPYTVERSLFVHAGLFSLLAYMVRYTDKSTKEMANLTNSLLTTPLITKTSATDEKK